MVPEGGAEEDAGSVVPAGSVGCGAVMGIVLYVFENGVHEIDGPAGDLIGSLGEQALLVGGKVSQPVVLRLGLRFQELVQMVPRRMLTQCP